MVMIAQTDSPTPPQAPPPTPSSRGGALDLLRFSAALLIMLYHYGNESPRRLIRYSELFERGYLATDFFLILSGYVLGRAYGPAILNAGVSTGRFWVRRASRIWPAHLIVLAAMGFYVLGGQLLAGFPPNPRRFGLESFFQQALLIHAWFPGVRADGWNLPSWSLSALLVCYLAFPWLWRALARVRPAVVLVLLGLGAVVMADAITREVFGLNLYYLPFNIGLGRAIPLFVLGACLARAAALQWPGEAASRILMWGGFVAVIALNLAGRFDFLSIVAIAAIILGAGRLPVKKPSKTMEALAKLAFALFITHALVGMLYYSQLHGLIYRVKIPLEIQWTMWAAGFPIAIAAAWAFDRWVDQPIQKRIRPWLSGKRVKADRPI
jgi:peptidoglycan/LPS O-acetylase OafA/YrhL